MSPRFATGASNSNPKLLTPRRGAALLGICAILLQAALFAWHHHPLPLSSRGAAVVLVAAPASGHSAPVLADKDCRICFALRHHSAAPVDFVGAPMMSGPLPLHLPPVETVWAPLRSYVLFRSRAPPRV
jgi:hypothetical protein